MNIRINRSYNTPHDYGPFTDLINEYINKIYLHSLDLYIKRYFNNKSTGTQQLDIRVIEDSLGYIDDYLYYNYQFNNDDFVSILNNLIKKIRFVTVFPPERRGLYGEFVENEMTLYINPELSSSGTLTSDERIRLYICHELGHVQNSLWMDRAKTIVEGLYYTYKSDNKREELQLMYDGFSLLDEATTQDRAEEITYYYSRKQRPFMARRRSRLFSWQPFKTNFDYYGELQEPAISFSRTLRGIGKIDNDEEALESLDQRALREDFADKIFEEYELDGQNINLYKLLIRLGKIKNAAYEVFSSGPEIYIPQSLQALEELNVIARNMRDCRDPRTH